jgi:hypothetical protein
MVDVLINGRRQSSATTSADLSFDLPLVRCVASEICSQRFSMSGLNGMAERGERDPRISSMNAFRRYASLPFGRESAINNFTQWLAVTWRRIVAAHPRQ